MGVLTRALLALCIARLWLMPLASSFWIDEMGTVFVVRMGAGHPSLAVAPQVPASLYFWLPRAVEWLLARAPAWTRGPGFLEAFYRLPSVLCMGLALWVIARVAARLIGPQAAWFCAFACLALRGFSYQAADARPYALGTLVGSLSVYCLIRWLDTARWQNAALFAAAAAVLWRVQLVYWPFYAVLAAYTVARLVRKDTAVTGLHAAGVFAAIGVLLAPAAVSALALFRQAGAHVIVARPGKSELWRSLKAGLIALCTGAAWLWARIGKSTTASRTPIAASSWVLIAAWWLVPPLGLFAFSWITGSSVFVDRYLSLSLPGAALAATAGAALFLNAFLDVRRWRIATVLLGSGVLLFLGQWRSVWPPHHNSDWRAAAHAASLAAGPDVPVLIPSPFIEAKAPAWSPSYRLPGFLYAHLAVYPVAGKPVLLPYSGGLESVDVGDLAHRGRFVIYGPYGGVRPLRAWILTQPQFAGWRERRLGDFGDVEAVAWSAPN